jgi:hypothetical protein
MNDKNLKELLNSLHAVLEKTDEVDPETLRFILGTKLAITWAHLTPIVTARLWIAVTALTAAVVIPAPRNVQLVAEAQS